MNTTFVLALIALIMAVAAIIVPSERKWPLLPLAVILLSIAVLIRFT